MKKIFLIISFISFISCKAQSPVYSIQEGHSRPGAYYKDLENVFDKFAGTWKYQNGNESLTIVLQNKTLYYDAFDSNYLDMLVGEYKYINTNGIELINTLSNLALNLQPYKNNIAGTLILDRDEPVNSRRVQLHFDDPEREYLKKSIRIKYIDNPGSTPDKIEIKWTGDTIITPEENSPITLRVPEKVYILTKQ
jgi:hypothetical protein